MLSEKQAVADFEVEHKFEKIGRKVMLLNVRLLAQQESREPMIMVAIEDITELFAGRFNGIDVLERQNHAINLVILRPVGQDVQQMPVALRVLHFALHRLDALQHFGDRLLQLGHLDVGPDIRKRPANVRRPHLDSGTIVGASKIARDIPDRRRADESRFRLAAIVDSADAPLSARICMQ